VIASLSVTFVHIILTSVTFVNYFLLPLFTFSIDFIYTRCYSLIKELQGGEAMTQGERVKSVRKANKMSMEQFGEKLGVTSHILCRK